MIKPSALALAVAMAAPVYADIQFSNFYVFGDSLLDSGNFSGRRFTNRVDDYATGDYARVAPQYLAEALGITLAPAAAGGSNWAVGGYETSDILNSINGSGLALPRNGTVVRPAFLTGQPRIDSRALVMLDGGGNDFLNGTANDQATTIAAAQRLLAAGEILHGAGANYILLSNLPDLGKTPALQAQDLSAPGSAATASAGAAGFNSALEAFSVVGRANLVPVDLAGLINYVSANAEQFGFAAGVNSNYPGVLGSFDQRYMCFDDTGGDCIEHPEFGIDSANPDPDKLLFNDGVHPTGRMGEITGDYLIDVVTAPQEAGLIPELGLNIMRAQQGHAAATQRELAANPGSSRWLLSGVAMDAEQAGDSENRSLSIGFSDALSEQLDAAVTVDFASHELESRKSSFSASSVGVSGALSYRKGNWRMQGAGGLSVVNYDSLDRRVQLADQSVIARGGTDGFGWHFDGLLSYQTFANESLALRPAVGARYLKADVEGYRESGGEVSNYEWGEQSRSSRVVKAGLMADLRLSQAVTAYVELFAASELEDQDETVEVRNRNLGFASYTMPSYRAEGDSFAEAALGLGARMGKSSVTVSVDYSEEGEGRETLMLRYSRPL